MNPNTARTNTGLPLYFLALLVALLPLLTTHVSYLVSAYYGAVEWCIPYWDSCTSISATGRQLPAKLIFKFGMIPSAIFAAILWWALWRWFSLKALSETETRRLAMPILGSLAALFLIQYTLALGELGDSYRLLRRSGVVLTFAFTYIAQLLFVYRIKQFSVRYLEFNPIYKGMLGLLILLLVVGMLSVILDAVLGHDYEAIEDAFEWWMALMLNGFFIFIAVLLKRQKVCLDIL